MVKRRRWTMSLQDNSDYLNIAWRIKAATRSASRALAINRRCGRWTICLAGGVSSNNQLTGGVEMTVAAGHNGNENSKYFHDVAQAVCLRFSAVTLSVD
jgi:hypothetical protein